MGKAGLLELQFQWVRSATAWLSDHLVVFLFILVPLYLILSVHVLLRNLS